MVEASLGGRHVLFVDDIVESGHTIDTILGKFRRISRRRSAWPALVDPCAA
jgi:hypoxanthine-guanine phosphoribosyltransferase